MMTGNPLAANPLTNLFAGLRDAKTSTKGVWLKEGQYVIRVKRSIWKVTRSKGDAFILELTVEKSNYLEKKTKAIQAMGSTPYDMMALEKLLPNQEGTSASWYQGLRDRDIGFGAVKGFAADILGMKAEDPAFIEQVEEFMQAVVYGRRDPVTGMFDGVGVINNMLIPVEVVTVKTGAGKDFGRHNWGQAYIG